MGEYLTAIWAIKNECTEFSGFVKKITRIKKALIGGFFNTSGKASGFLGVSRFVHVHHEGTDWWHFNTSGREKCNVLWISCAV